MPINAGRLDQQITIQQRVDAVNSLGENVYTWTDVITVWAAADQTRGREFFAASQPQAESPVAFRIRWRSGIHERMRVLWRGVAHDIAAPPVDAYGMKETLDLFCVAGVRDGR